MARFLVALCALTALFATLLLVFFAVGKTPHSLMNMVACVLLIDQSMMTILFFLAKRLATPLRLVVLVGSVGIAIGGILLIVQNATQQEAEPQFLVSALGAVAIVQGVVTAWQIAGKGAPEAPK